jgi:hypothetical protein
VSVARGAWTGAALALALWMSLDAIIVIAGSLVALLVSKTRQRPRADRRSAAWLLVGGIPALVFGVLYLTHYRPEGWLATYLDRFWVLRFWTGGPPGLADRIWRSVIEVVSPTFVGHPGDLLPGIILALMALGAWRLARSGPTAAVVIGPLLLWAVLAVLRLYPVTTRLGLFAAPCLTILVVCGWEALSERWRHASPRVGGAVALLVVAWLLLPELTAGIEINRTALASRSHARPVVTTLMERKTADEPVYVYARAQPEWLYYTTDWTAPDLDRIHLVLDEYRSPDGRTFANAPNRPAPIGPTAAGLRYLTDSGEEVYGLYSGFEQAAGLRGGGSTVDPGWAELEVGRMLQSAPDCLWLVAFHTVEVERDRVRQLLSDRGYRVALELISARSRIDRVCTVSAHRAPRRPEAPGTLRRFGALAGPLGPSRRRGPSRSRRRR